MEISKNWLALHHHAGRAILKFILILTWSRVFNKVSKDVTFELKIASTTHQH